MPLTRLLIANSDSSGGPAIVWPGCAAAKSSCIPSRELLSPQSFIQLNLSTINPSVKTVRSRSSYCKAFNRNSLQRTTSAERGHPPSNFTSPPQPVPQPAVQAKTGFGFPVIVPEVPNGSSRSLELQSFPGYPEPVSSELGRLFVTIVPRGPSIAPSSSSVGFSTCSTTSRPDQFQV